MHAKGDCYIHYFNFIIGAALLEEWIAKCWSVKKADPTLGSKNDFETQAMNNNDTKRLIS
jgi:hypothetical protein